MSNKYRPYAPNQILLLPPSLDEWVAQDHIARFIGDVVDELDLSAITAGYEDELRGYPPFHPAMMVKVPEGRAQRNFTDPDSRMMRGSDKQLIQAYNAQAAFDADTQVIVAADVTNQAADSPHLPMVNQVAINTGKTPGGTVRRRWLLQSQQRPDAD